MAKNIQSAPSPGGRKKSPTKPRRRTRAKAAQPTSIDQEDHLDDDIASLRAALAGRVGDSIGSDENVASGPQGGNGNAQMGEDYLDFLTKAFANMGSGQWDTHAFDSMANGAALIMGSGPAFAALGSMMAGATAQSAILMNATQTQRQLDQVGLCCTSACVKQLLSMNNGRNSD